MTQSLNELNSNCASEPHVTIGICVKDSEKTIRKCLESIFNQNYDKGLLEIIIVDGESKDNTLNISEELTSKSGISTKIFSDKSKGLSVARQLVLDNTKNKYVVFVDSDVLLAPDFIKSQVKFMENCSGMAVVFGKYEYQKGLQKSLPATLSNLSKNVGSLEWARSTKRKGFPPNDASIYLVAATKHVGGFDLSITGASEDEDMILRLTAQGWFIAINEKARFYALSRATWSSVWMESVWFGYGKHFLNHKNKGTSFFLRYLPLIYVYVGLKLGVKSYKLTLEKKSFFIPLLTFFRKIALYVGFVNAHHDGYGHAKK